VNPISKNESRIAALISAYADHAPIDVEPVAMTRLAAASSRRRWWLAGSGPTYRGLALVLLIGVLLISMVAGALIAGAEPFRRDPEKILTERGFVEPYVGLPPEGAQPSTPETGDVIFSFTGRVRSIGLDAHWMQLYADGRLIWHRNLDGITDEGRLAFGASELTTAVIEQRLTPEGVQLLRTAVIAGGLDRGLGVGPGLCCWGGLLFRDGQHLVQMTWSDPLLPGLLANPASWLPPTAWADQRVGGYVPRQYAICGAVPDALARLPGTARDLILASATGRILQVEGAECHLVPTGAAREIAAALEAAGIHLKAADSGLDSVDGVPFIWIAPIGPDGEPLHFGG
jgi:hypothetical protein